MEAKGHLVQKILPEHTWKSIYTATKAVDDELSNDRKVRVIQGVNKLSGRTRTVGLLFVKCCCVRRRFGGATHRRLRNVRHLMVNGPHNSSSPARGFRACGFNGKRVIRWRWHVSRASQFIGLGARLRRCKPNVYWARQSMNVFHGLLAPWILHVSRVW